MAKSPATPKPEKAPLNFDGPYLIYDTETNGLPIYERPSEMQGQPRIVELVALLIDKHDQVLDRISTLIRPDKENWIIPKDIQLVHGITTERCIAEGANIAEVMEAFVPLVRRASFRVAHNDAFDARMVRIELAKRGQKDLADGWWKEFPSFDTQHKSTRYCKLPPSEKMMAANRRSFKTPKLEEAFAHFFPGDPLLAKAHAAESDVEMCRRIFWAIQRTPEPEIEQAPDAPRPEPKKAPAAASSISVTPFAGADE